jgi:hypothetical protein
MKENPYHELVLERIAERYDPDAILDCLGADSADVVEKFRLEILANLDLFEDIE